MAKLRLTLCFILIVCLYAAEATVWNTSFGGDVQHLQVTKVNDKALLNVSDLHAGLYLLMIQINTTYSVVKFIKD